MDNVINRKEIIKDSQIKKFCFYGFFKNLKFFEPYLLIFLLSQGISLLEIGILIAIREVLVNLFEIPSGIIADYFGRKKELYFCFIFYIISFVIFFFTNSFFIAIFAMIFFGLGEAFRSGTHKAMIYSYLDTKSWSKEKAFVYGRTRSFSLIGSTISSLVSIVLIIYAPNDNYIFLFSVIPYVLDLLLIMSYPKYLDTIDIKEKSNAKGFFSNLITNFKSNKKLKSIIIEEGIAEGSYSYIKDFIQPILEIIIIGSGIMLISELSADDNLKIILGILYAVLNLIGTFFSRKAYLLKDKRPSLELLSILHITMFITFGALAFFTTNYIVVFLTYVLFYILHSIRKPLFVDEIDNNIDKSIRATTLSLTSQLKSLFLIIFAPLFGFIADNYGIKYVMFGLCIMFLITIPLLRKRK